MLLPKSVFVGTCADLLNHPLESNNTYFLSALLLDAVL